MILLSFCSFPWWLSWLLPFLLGLLLGWALWSKYKSMVADLEGEVSSLKNKIGHLEGDIKGNKHTIAELEGDLSLAKGKMREAENALAKCLEGKGGKGSGTSNSGSGAIGSSGIGAATGVSALTSSSNDNAGKSSSHLVAVGANNLQIIEGIGPKMEEILKANGVNNWSDLASKSAVDLREILNKYGDKYKIIDVTTWQQQAQFAANDDQEGLIAMQKNIAGGNDKTLTTSDSKLEKYLIRKGILKAYKQDDLKAVEGIGPKIEGLLKAAGIDTWKALSEASIDTIKKVLDDAGPRYKLADPGTWPKQSELADAGKWDELQVYQDQLTRGK